jgi:hypothetical protein
MGDQIRQPAPTGARTMPSPFDVILILCAWTGAVMVFGSIFLLYRGIIKLSEKSSARGFEADFKNQLKINVRNPALGLFVFFGLALYFAKPEQSRLVLTGHMKVPDVEGIFVKLRTEEPITLSSEGDIFTTIQPVEKLWVEISAPRYRPPQWRHQITPDEARNGRVEIRMPRFQPTAGIALTTPKLESPPQFISSD